MLTIAPPPSPQAHVGEQLDGLRRGIVDDHRRLRGREYRIDCHIVGEIRPQRLIGIELSGQRMGRRAVVVIMDRNSGARFRQSTGDALAKIAACTRDENLLPGKAQEVMNVDLAGIPHGMLLSPDARQSETRDLDFGALLYQ